MKRLPFAILCVSLRSASALADPSSQADLNSVLQAIQGVGAKVDALESRVDALQGEVDSIKQNREPPAPRPPAPITASPARPGPGTVSYEPGWVIDVRPQPLKGQSPESVGRFIAELDGFLFGEFRKHVPAPGWASFHGEALFDAKTDGRYVFSIQISNPENISGPRLKAFCSTQLALEGKDIISPKLSLFPISKHWTGDISTFARSFQGAQDLQAGAYNLEFVVYCDMSAGESEVSDLIFTNYPSFKAWFDKIRVTTLVKGPDDMNSRRPAPNELVHIAKKKAVLEPSASPAAPSRPSIPVGATRVAVKEFNIRTSPRTDAPLAHKVAPGDRLEIIAATPDQEWARVAIAGRTLGFVKGSVLASNSN